MNLRKLMVRGIITTSLSVGLVLSGSLLAAAAQTLTVWVGDGDVRLKEYQVVVKAFEEQNPGIKVELQLQSGTQTQIMQKLALAIAGGAAPDVSWVEGSSVVEYAAQGLFTDVTKAIDGIKFAPADTQEMTYNGRMWAVPYHTAVRGLFKRVDFFEQAGLNPNTDPKSLDEMYAWNQKLIKVDGAGKITRAGMMPWVGNWGAPAWFWTFGGKLTETDGKAIRPTATFAKNIEALEWISYWAQSYGHATPVSGGHTGFLNGSVAMSTESTSSVNRFIQAQVPFTTGRVPSPSGGANGTWGAGTAVAVPVNAPNMQLALKLARFFGETNVQVERFSFAPDTLPANWQALLTVGRKLSKEWGPLLDQFPDARPRPPLWIEYYVNQLQPAMNQVVAGSKTPLQALTNVQQIMDARYKEIFH